MIEHVLKKISERNIFKRLVLLSLLCVSVVGNFFLLPLAKVNPNELDWVGRCIGVLYLFKIVGVYRAKNTLYGKFPGFSEKKARTLIGLSFVAGVLVTVFPLNPFPYLFLIGVNFFHIKISDFWSVEERYAQIIVFHFLIVTILCFTGYSGNYTLIIISLFNSIGVLLFSAAFEKLQDKTWRNGIAMKKIMCLPNHIWRFYGFLKKLPEWFFFYLGMVVLIFQIGMIFTGANFYALLLGLIALFIFGLTLSLVFNLTFVGFWVLLSAIIFFKYASITSSSGQLVINDLLFIALLVLNILNVVSVLFFYSFPVKIHKWMKFTLLNGVGVPSGMFTARSILSASSYKVCFNGKDLDSGIYNQDGFPSVDFVWCPLYLHVYGISLMDAWEKGEKGVSDLEVTKIRNIFKDAKNISLTGEGKYEMWVKPFETPVDFEKFEKEPWQLMCSSFYSNEIGFFNFRMSSFPNPK